VINIAKNFYLYFTYKHGSQALIKVEGQPDEIEGRWKANFDSFGDGFDVRHIVDFKVNSDSTGIYYEKNYSTRVTGKNTEPYSWGAIFPFDKNDFYEYQYKVFIDSLYIMHLPDSNTRFQDTLYSKYKISNDSLYIGGISFRRYTEKPSWSNPHSGIITFFDMFIPYLY
jgi:hypothetical protein